jgi:tetratricopeptide (TPR) repeat protein
MQMAARAGNPRAAEPTAWAYTRLATYQWQAGETEQALQSCAAGLEMAPEYAPALLLRGRIFLAARRFSESIDSLRRAAALTSLPEYQWALAEALRDSGNEPEARACETLIQQRGATEDPRTLALFLATRGLEVQKAVRLAEAELKNRADVFTHDALAWSLAAAGQFSLAHDQMKLALAEGTQDARLFYHAAVIAAALDQKEEATRWWTKAAPLQHTLLPSEREELSRKFKNFAVARTGNPVSPPL